MTFAGIVAAAIAFVLLRDIYRKFTTVLADDRAVADGAVPPPSCP